MSCSSLPIRDLNAAKFVAVRCSNSKLHMQAALPVADIIYKHLEEAKEEGHGEKDWGSIALVVREQSSS